MVKFLPIPTIEPAEVVLASALSAVMVLLATITFSIVTKVGLVPVSPTYPNKPTAFSLELAIVIWLIVLLFPLKLPIK